MKAKAGKPEKKVKRGAALARCLTLRHRVTLPPSRALSSVLTFHPHGIQRYPRPTVFQLSPSRSNRARLIPSPFPTPRGRLARFLAGLLDRPPSTEETIVELVPMKRRKKDGRNGRKGREYERKRAETIWEECRIAGTLRIRAIKYFDVRDSSGKRAAGIVPIKTEFVRSRPRIYRRGRERERRGVHHYRSANRSHARPLIGDSYLPTIPRPVTGAGGKVASPNNRSSFWPWPDDASTMQLIRERPRTSRLITLFYCSGREPMHLAGN